MERYIKLYEISIKMTKNSSIDFQEFVLNLKALDELKRKEKSLKLVEALETLVNKLSSDKYEVLQSTVNISGLPVKIMVGGESGRLIKDDFYKYAGQLPYNSGSFYFRL